MLWRSKLSCIDFSRVCGKLRVKWTRSNSKRISFSDRHMGANFASLFIYRTKNLIVIALVSEKTSVDWASSKTKTSHQNYLLAENNFLVLQVSFTADVIIIMGDSGSHFLDHLVDISHEIVVMSHILARNIFLLWFRCWKCTAVWIDYSHPAACLYISPLRWTKIQALDLRMFGRLPSL